jgi:hypothetical protein
MRFYGYHLKRYPSAGIALVALLVVAGCGYRFAGAPKDNPFPADIKTIVIKSADNTTTVTGIESELTNELRDEFALGTRLSVVRSGGDAILRTLITAYKDTPATYKADGKELTRIGTLRVHCSLKRADNEKVLWKKELASSYTYNVTDSVSETLANRRRAISRMIKDLITSIHRSLYDNF